MSGDEIVPRARRRQKQDQGESDEYRSPFERDRDRVLYSYEFRRLSGVSQVAAAGETHLLHNRMTHSLKVAQLGRRFTQRLLALAARDPRVADVLDHIGGLDPDVVETGGMAHDLGHPPFGHVAEDVLDELLGDHGGFEGNAQTFRIVTKLSTRKTGISGLDLTFGSMNAILKYPKVRTTTGTTGSQSEHPDQPWTDRHVFSKPGVYPSEIEDFDAARAILPEDARAFRSPESILVDWADDVSYAVHDAEDFFRAHLLPLHRLEDDRAAFVARSAAKLKSRKGETFDEGAFAEAVDRLIAKRVGIVRSYRNQQSDVAALHRFASDRITEFEEAIEVIDTPPYIQIRRDEQYEALALMELTWYFVIDQPALASVQEGHRQIIEDVVGKLFDWTADPRHPRLPMRLRDLIGISSEDGGDRHAAASAGPDFYRWRAVADYVTGLTEQQMLDLHSRLTGSRPASMFGAWL